MACRMWNETRKGTYVVALVDIGLKQQQQDDLRWRPWRWQSNNKTNKIRHWVGNITRYRVRIWHAFERLLLQGASLRNQAFVGLIACKRFIAFHSCEQRTRTHDFESIVVIAARIRKSPSTDTDFRIHGSTAVTNERTNGSHRSRTSRISRIFGICTIEVGHPSSKAMMMMTMMMTASRTIMLHYCKQRANTRLIDDLVSDEVHAVRSRIRSKY